MLLNIFYTFLTMGSLYASADSFFKKVPKENSYSQISSIDHIYLINLDFREDRLKRSLNELEKFNIIPQRFSAVYGKEIVEQGFCDPRYDKKKPGEIGCILSHLSILQDAYDNNYQMIWILEDDIWVRENPNVLNKLIKKLDQLVGRSNWDVLYTDPESNKNRVSGNVSNRNCKNWRKDSPIPDADLAIKKRVGEDFVRIGFRSRTHSMIITRSGIEKILNHFKDESLSGFIPYDIELGFVPNIKQYMLTYPLVTWSDTPDSDIQKETRVNFNQKSG